MNNKLPIDIQHNLSASLLYANPLSIINANKNLVPWIHENYILVEGIDYKNEQMLIYTDGYSISNLHYNNSLIKFDSIPVHFLYVDNLCKNIMEAIDDHAYVYIYLDEYYILNSIGGGRRHYLHEIMVYGYDREREIIYAVTLDATGHYNAIEESFKNVQIAFLSESLKNMVGEAGDLYYEWEEKNRFILIDGKQYNEPYVFDVKNFKSKIVRYLSGEHTSEELYFAKVSSEYRFMGSKYYDLLISKIKNDTGYQLLDTGYQLFNLINHLYEHKKNMVDKLEYLALISKKNEIGTLAEKYKQEVYLPIRTLRFLMLKIKRELQNHKNINIENKGIIIEQKLKITKYYEINIFSDIVKYI